ncbi:hypothetical protein SAMN05444050_4040 [Afipia sp. GAS231]|nr:hypothetical protein SAMN05444050_4040 [Afipia sp. GAS231]
MNSIRAILRMLHALIVPSLKPAPVRVDRDRNSRRISS